jgi:C4-dicarboxylate-specific signal transduction histidine kinase
MEQILDAAWVGALHPDDASHLMTAWGKILASGLPGEVEARMRRADGEYRWILFRGYPMRDEEGNVVRWYGANTDIEDRKRTEVALSTAHSNLAHVARVTALSTLTASIAHEVNQPLSGIVTNASTCMRMLDANPPNIEGARETVLRTIRDGHRASDVITRLRALFTKKDFAPEPVDLNEATREVIVLSSGDLQKSRVVLWLELADDLPSISGDRVQLQQVILNLLLNASEAMSEVNDGAREVIIRTEREGSDRVRVTVQDTGVGINSESRDQLFTDFYTTKSAGMGIGLSISRSIVERHQGRIWTEPKDGPGATFCFSIPCAPEV